MILTPMCPLKVGLSVGGILKPRCPWCGGSLSQLIRWFPRGHVCEHVFQAFALSWEYKYGLQGIVRPEPFMHSEPGDRRRVARCFGDRIQQGFKCFVYDSGFANVMQIRANPLRERRILHASIVQRSLDLHKDRRSLPYVKTPFFLLVKP